MDVTGEIDIKTIYYVDVNDYKVLVKTTEIPDLQYRDGIVAIIKDGCNRHFDGYINPEVAILKFIATQCKNRRDYEIFGSVVYVNLHSDFINQALDLLDEIRKIEREESASRIRSVIDKLESRADELERGL